MPQKWFQRFRAALAQRVRHGQVRRSRGQNLNSYPADISQVEPLESRRMLSATTNLVNVSLIGTTLHLTDGSPKSATGDDYTISYTATQVVLTGQNGTAFLVGNQTQTTYTLTTSGTISMAITLNRNANTLTLTGDGTTVLGYLSINMGAGKQSNSLTLTKVQAQSVYLTRGGNDASVTFNQCEIFQNLSVNMGSGSGDVLTLDTTTISGNTTVRTGEFNVSGTTFDGTLNDRQMGKNSVMNATDTTFTGKMQIRMGKDGVINYLYSAAGSNHIIGKATYIGKARHNIQINQGAGSTANNISPTVTQVVNARMVHTNQVNVPVASNSAPTVTSLAAATTTPTITGTYTASSSTTFTVAVNGTTYTLGTSTQLTSPSTGNWSLNLTGAALPTTTSSFTVTATSIDKFGNEQTATGTVTNEQAIIKTYVTAKNETSSDVVTSSGLNYYITTQGTGAKPTSGQTLSVEYTGHILNSDGTLGAEFDSNIDGTHPSDPDPFKFALGQGAVIAGWDEAFALLPVGTSATLIIPSSLGYGTAGSGTSIPANSILVFTVKLIAAA